MDHMLVPLISFSQILSPLTNVLCNFTQPTCPSVHFISSTKLWPPFTDPVGLSETATLANVQK